MDVDISQIPTQATQVVLLVILVVVGHQFWKRESWPITILCACVLAVSLAGLVMTFET